MSMKAGQVQEVKEKSSVAVEKRTRIRLDNLGIRHETYDQIINRLIDEHEESEEYKKKSKK